MKIVITGTSGFVGRHLVSRLLIDGHHLVSITRSDWRHEGVVSHRLKNFTDHSAWTGLLAGADVVINLAARAHILDDHDADPAKAFRQANVESVGTLCQAARDAGVARVIQVSSIGVNGSKTNGVAFTEGDLPMPTELYAQSKWEAEQAVSRLLGVGPTDFVILRPPLVYGNGCPGNFRRLLALTHKLPVVPLGALRQMRSFIHVGNLCDAIAHTVRHPAAARRTFLLSDGVDHSVAEVAALLCQGFGRPASVVWSIPISLLNAAASMAGKRQVLDKLACELLVDSSAFRRATGWTPPYRSTEGLIEAAQGYASTQC